jgi:2-dehydro-3-deoxyphosphogluconate aldolase / (4S)-4-hydroxy-2-oxoglutarate aldolase
LTGNGFTADFRKLLRAERIIAIVRADSAQQAVATGRALVDAGIRVLEVSLNTPAALEAIAELTADTLGSGVLVGAGTVLDAATVTRAAEAGARFYVSPVFDRKAIDAAAEAQISAVPGCMTPSEMLAAYAAGAAALKIFPAAVWTPDALANVLRAMPFLPVVPTGGITIDNAAAWLVAGSTALGIGSSLTERSSGIAELRKTLSDHTKDHAS